eukprot:260694-Chlamydomonas_euryale.AAC.4
MVGLLLLYITSVARRTLQPVAGWLVRAVLASSPSWFMSPGCSERKWLTGEGKNIRERTLLSPVDMGEW